MFKERKEGDGIFENVLSPLGFIYIGLAKII